ncbi:MAG TPA: family 43 glycosylhydrolase [Jiangellaceae bacterium]
MNKRTRFTATAAAAVLCSAGLAGSALADNPIVTDIYTADPAALVHDGRMYIYTGRDEAAPTQNNFVMREWRLFSSDAPAPDPQAWTDHGSPLSLEDFAWADANAWASEVEQGPDGRFYWYVSVDGNTDDGWMNIGVAVGDEPTGPFTDAIGGPLISDDMANSSALNIDPTVLVDDDGQVYMWWGSFWQPRMVVLNENMVELDSEIITPEGLTEFWEAPWVFKRDGVYYMAYASNANIGGDGCVTSSNFACIRYATADDPMGPWTHQGIVLDQVSSTTNHPAIVEYPEGSDEWWMVYHTADAPDGGNFRRSVAIDRLFFNDDGTMQKVVQTPEPVEPDPEPTDNAALSATPSASYTSPWETVTAINDGIDPPQSNDATNPRWGTWPETGTHWVQFDWDRPVRVDGSDMYFFQDVPDTVDGGVKAPAEWSIQYWDGEQFVDVSNPSGYGTALDRYNTTTFDPVTTTRIRATLESQEFSGAGGTGVLEWKVYSDEPTGVDPVEVTTPVGVPPELPETVTLRYEDGERLEAGVWWRPFDEKLLNTGGTFTVTGVIENNLVEAEATVHVDNCPDGFSTDVNITFGDAGSGVPNYDQGDGCTFLDVVWAEEPFTNHGAFVETVEAIAEAWEETGVLTGREVGMVIAAAAESDVAGSDAPTSP